MALTPERKAQMDAAIQQVAKPTVLTQERRAQMDAVLGSQAQAQTQPGLVQGIVQGIAKPFLRTATNLLNVGEGVIDLARGDVQGANEAATKSRNFGYFGQDIRPVGVSQEGEVKDFGGFTKDIVGTGAEIGSIAAPGAGATNTARKAITQGVRPALRSVIADQALIGATSGALGSAGQEAQEDNSTLGSIAGKGLAGGAIGAAVGGAIPVAGATVRSVTGKAGSLGSEILGRSTGMGDYAVREAFNNPNVAKYARKAGKDGADGLMTEALADTKNALDNMTSSNNKAYREAMAKIKATEQDFSNAMSDIRQSVTREATDNFGVRFAEGPKLNNLDFNASDIVEGTASVQRAFDRMFGEPISSVADMDRLKKSLGRIAQGAPNGSPAQALIYKMKDNVSRALKDNVPGYSEEMARFSDAISLSDDIERALSLKDTVQKDTAIRKLMSTMRQNNEFRLAMLQALEQSGGKDITGKIAGATAAPLVPRGLVGALSGIATPTGISLSIINPTNIPYLMLWLSITSPRLVTEAVSLLGKFKGKTIPAIVKQQFRNLLIKAANESNGGENRATPPADLPNTQAQLK